MKELQTNTIYLIGIGGIGMSALARYFKQQGKEVSGYDRTETPLTRQLAAEGMNIHYTDDPAYVPCDAGLVIYTPAIPETNRELQYCMEGEFTVMKRAEVLGLITDDYYTIAIAGTHGKTSISSMTAHMMHHSGHEATALIGGIMNNYDTNMLYASKSKYLIAEADEYDRSFLKLHPKVAVVSTVSADHLDIYGSLENMKESFSRFVQQTDENGLVIIHEDVLGQIETPSNALVYGQGKEASLRIKDVRVVEHHYHFLLESSKGNIDIRMLVPGMHNIENATAAAAVCLHAGMDLKEIKAGLESYRGVKRRFEFVLDDTEGIIFIDDYAHHPDEIEACISTARKLYPEKKICGVFQPHLFTRTRDFADGFARTLEMLDELILLEIYPAREEPIPGVDAKMLLDMITIANKSICSKEDLPDMIKARKPDVLLTMGAGDIDRLLIPIKEKLITA
ncbi:MAG: UDP-N-acetylmuramate--L-alanine ligase [Bacteroidetes bacterium]|nr:MAG: UDP-N-acetylmuramate--L-alanine ligase [Bacteroidota bacterium]